MGLKKNEASPQSAWKPVMFPIDSKEMNEANQLLSDLLKINTTNTADKETGNEIEAALFCEKILKNEGFTDITIIESIPTRANLICRWKGIDPGAPTLCLSHLDVVPADARNWERDPFCGDIDGEYIWGRGAIDCKGMVASEMMACILLKREGYQPKGDIILFLCADEEEGGDYGVEFIAKNHWDKIKADLTINEGGGFLLPIGKDPKDYIIQVGEKGVFWTKVKVMGQGGHGSMPVSAKKSAMYKISEITQRIIDYKPPIEVGTAYRDMIDAISLPNFFKPILKSKRIIRPLVKMAGIFAGDSIPQLILPLVTDSLTPTGFEASSKVNIIPQTTEMTFDCRLLLKHNREDVKKHLRRALGRKLFKEIEIIPLGVSQSATINPKNEKYWNKVTKIMNILHPGANLVPMFSAGSTDSKYIREKGHYSLGICPMRMDPNMPYSEMSEMMHGKNERIWIPNYAYAIEFFVRLIKQM